MKTAEQVGLWETKQVMFTQPLYQLYGPVSRKGPSKDQEAATIVTAPRKAVRLQSSLRAASHVQIIRIAVERLFILQYTLAYLCFHENKQLLSFFFLLELLINISYMLFMYLIYTNTVCLSFKTGVTIQTWIAKSHCNPESWFSYFTFLCYVDKVITSGFDFWSAYFTQILDI